MRIKNPYGGERDERNERTALRIAALRRAVRSAPELMEIIDAILAGSDPRPRHLAGDLGLPVTEIYRRLKRLRRRALSSAALG